MVEMHGGGYKDLMEESDTYSVSGVLWGHLCVWGIFSSGGSIGKMDGLCVWVEM